VSCRCWRLEAESPEDHGSAKSKATQAILAIRCKTHSFLLERDTWLVSCTVALAISAPQRQAHWRKTLDTISAEILLFPRIFCGCFGGEDLHALIISHLHNLRARAEIDTHSRPSQPLCGTASSGSISSPMLFGVSHAALISRSHYREDIVGLSPWSASPWIPK
jgi:hypothetical protein